MEKISKYELREVLGRGGMGVVYKAYDPLIDREVAIKVILEKALDTADTKARFIREARTAGRLSHENIMVIHDLGEIDGKTYIVMEYLPGKDLRSIIDQKDNLTLGEKLSYARQVCRGLHYAHSNMIIHRDIKPENIKVLRDGRVKIMDFGIAKPYAPITDASTIDTEQGLTRVGMRIGTPWYMSPEQVKGLRVDKRADIFSFGVVLYELLTYTKPFQGDDTTVLYKILHEEPPPIQLEESGLNAELQRILSRCLAKEPEQRYGDCLLLLRDLDAIPDRPVDPHKVPQLLAEGDELAGQDRLAEATRKFEEVLNIDPQNKEARSSLEWLSIRGNESATLRVLNGKIVGDVISHFRILQKIGGGGMGVVYKAEDVTLKRLVALKFLLPDRIRDDTAKKRFFKEAQTASALDHPNICTIHEINETEDGLIFICMAYYTGESLKTKIQKGPLDIRTAVDIALGIARGLAAAHEHGIVHRDVKPANVVITPDGGIKIVDFGLAKLSGTTRITRIGSTMGTLPYMSPEQIKGLDPDHRTDIWSFGAMLYQITTGSLPFQGEYEAAVAHSIVNEEPKPPSKIRREIPAGLEETILRCLKKNLEQRTGSMQHVLTSLEKVREGLARTTTLDLARSAELRRLMENGKIYMERRQYDEALTRFEAALRLSPEDAPLMALREESAKKLEEMEYLKTLLRDANALYLKGKLQEADEKVKQVISIEPNQPEASELAAAIRDKLEHIEGVDKLLTDAGFYVRHGKFEEAATCYEKILEVDPSNRDAAKGLKKVEKEKGEKTKRERARTPVPGTSAGRRNLLVPIIIGAVVVIGGGILLLLPSGKTPEPVQTVVPGIDSSGWVAEMRNQMEVQKGAAVDAEAGKWAASVLDSAQQIERLADRLLASKNYLGSYRSYESAKDVFHAATEEAKRSETVASAGTNELADMTKRAREDMLAHRRAADDAGGRKAAPALYDEALAQERKADKLLQVGDRTSLLVAHTAFTRARDGYENVLRSINNNITLRKEADSRKTEMDLAKRKVTGEDQEKRGNSSFRQASDAESQGLQMYRQRNYEGARDEFGRATKLFGDADRELIAGRTGAKAVETQKIAAAGQKEPDKVDPAAKEKEERAAAERDIQKLLESYRTYMERGDVDGLTGLLNLNESGRTNYSDFFSLSDQRNVSITNVVKDITGASASVSFKSDLTYYNKSTQESLRVPTQAHSWSLEHRNGTWKVVSQK
jgi:serine/threonine protein kinase